MKREPTPTAGELAEGLRQLCPGREGDFVTALRWLYDHPREAAALCGLPAGGGKEKSHKRKREITARERENTRACAA